LINEEISLSEYLFSNGDEYDGEWVRGMKQGHGTMKYSDGTIYDVSDGIHHVCGKKWKKKVVKKIKMI
jgi:hypothetical protein